MSHRRQLRPEAGYGSFSNMPAFLRAIFPGGVQRVAFKYDVGGQYQGSKPILGNGMNKHTVDDGSEDDNRRYKPYSDTSGSVMSEDSTDNETTSPEKEEEDPSDSENNTASVHSEEEDSDYVGSDKEKVYAAKRQKAMEYDTDTSSVTGRTGRRYGTIARGLCPHCLKSCRNVREQVHSPTMCKNCRHMYCWRCKADWADIELVGRLGHREYCSRYPQMLRRRNGGPDGVRVWVERILAIVRSSNI